MRGTTLDQLVEQLRAECRLSTDSSRGVENRSWLVQILNRTYEVLWDDYEWEFLHIKREDAKKALQAGQRYYDIPSDMEVDQATNCWINYGNVWLPLQYGIDYSCYSQLDPDKGMRADPAQRWCIRNDGQFEIWPMPASDNTQQVAFEGRRKFKRLAANSDRCLLDDALVVLFAAAEILKGNKQPDADSKLTMAQARLAKVRAKAADRKRVRIGMGSPADAQRGYPRIRAVYNTRNV